MKFLQTKPQVKNGNNNYYDLYYTVIRNRDGKELVDDKYEKIETDYNNFNDFITPNHYVGIKIDNSLSGWKNSRSHLNHFRSFLLYK